MFQVADLLILDIQGLGCLSSQFLVLILLNSQAASNFPLLSVSPLQKTGPVAG
jgi:hypothetical protein